jgi:O-antigen ligase
MRLLDFLAAAYTFSLVAFTGLSRGYVIPNVLFVLFLGSVLFESFRDGYQFRFNRIVLGFSIVTIASLLPILAGVAASDQLAIEHVIRSVQILTMLIVYVGYLDSSVRIRLIANSAAVGFLTAFVVGHLILHRTLAERAVALYQNPNSAAFWAMFTLFARWVSDSLRQRKRRDALSVLFSITTFIASIWLIWASQSRKVLLALGFPFLILLIHRIWRSNYRLPLTLMLVALLAGTITIAYQTLPIHQQHRISTAIEGLRQGQMTERALINRLEYYRTGFQLIEENPVLGKGGGAFFVLGRERSLLIRENIDSHSVYLDVYIESGILGLVAYLALFGSALIVIVQCQARPLARWMASSFILAILFIQFGGSIQLDKYMWLAMVLLEAWTLQMNPPGDFEEVSQTDPTPIPASM